MIVRHFYFKTTFKFFLKSMLSRMSFQPKKYVFNGNYQIIRASYPVIIENMVDHGSVVVGVEFNAIDEINDDNIQYFDYPLSFLIQWDFKNPNKWYKITIDSFESNIYISRCRY